MSKDLLGDITLPPALEPDERKPGAMTKAERTAKRDASVLDSIAGKPATFEDIEAALPSHLKVDVTNQRRFLEHAIKKAAEGQPRSAMLFATKTAAQTFRRYCNTVKHFHRWMNRQGNPTTYDDRFENINTYVREHKDGWMVVAEPDSKAEIIDPDTL